MGRSVSVPSNAIETIYLDVCDIDPDFGWDDLIEDIRNVVREKYPSMKDNDSWVAREERSILCNGHAQIVVAEYCGIASVSLVAEQERLWYDEEQCLQNLHDAWCNQIKRNWYVHMVERFRGTAYERIGRMSNGVGVYRHAG